MENSRKIKSVMLGIMDGKGRRGRPNMEWIDNIKEWCKKNPYILTTSALDRKVWKQTIKFALDTYGPWILMMMSKFNNVCINN